MRFQIEEALRGKAVRLARIAAVIPQHESKEPKMRTYEDLQTVDPMDMAMDVFRKKYGGEEMPEVMKTLLQSVIQEVGL